MDRETVIRLAREAGIPETETEGIFRANSDDLGRLIAAVEANCVPPGWKVVPIEPTTEMIDAMTTHTGASYGVDYRTRKGYAAMLAAAPAQKEES